MIGANEMAFPRLNAFSFWMFLLGGIILYFSFLAGGMPNVGWFSYAPLSEKITAHRQESTIGSISLIADGNRDCWCGTEFCRHNTYNAYKGNILESLALIRMDGLYKCILILAAFPVLNAGLVMILIDRQFACPFFHYV